MTLSTQQIVRTQIEDARSVALRVSLRNQSRLPEHFPFPAKMLAGRWPTRDCTVRLTNSDRSVEHGARGASPAACGGCDGWYGALSCRLKRFRIEKMVCGVQPFGESEVMSVVIFLAEIGTVPLTEGRTTAIPELLPEVWFEQRLQNPRKEAEVALETGIRRRGDVQVTRGGGVWGGHR